MRPTGLHIRRIAHAIDRVHYRNGGVEPDAGYLNISAAAPPALDNIALLGREAGGDDVINLARHAAEGLGKLIPLDFGGAARSKVKKGQIKFVMPIYRLFSEFYFEFLIFSRFFIIKRPTNNY